MDLKDEERLANYKVRDISLDLLREYNDGAHTAKTPVEEIKHFLPRYIEFITQFKFPTHSEEICFRLFSPFYENEWTEQEL